jgi:hypothetical protein
MKGLVATIAVTAVLLGIAGVASAQYSYGDYANQYQGYYGQYGQQADYGQYGQAQGGYNQYGQAYGGYDQYTQPQQGYGQARTPYGQQQYMPYQQGQGASGSYSNSAYPGYSEYGQQGQYGNQQAYGQARPGAASAYSQQTPRRRQARQPAQVQTVAPQGQNPRITVTEQPVSRGPSVQSSQTSSRESSSIYWDGRETVDDGTGGTPGQAPQTVQPQAPGMRQTARTNNGSAVVQPARRAPQNAVRQNTASLPAPPPKRSMRWGQQEASTVDGPASASMSTAQKPESRRALPPAADDNIGQQRPSTMKWGKQDRPTIVGSEPGSPQGTSTLSRSDAGAQESAETTPAAKRFEWGKNR